MKFTGKSNSTTTLPTTVPNLRDSHRPTVRARKLKPRLTHQRRSGVPGRRRSKPETPPLKWKVKDRNKEQYGAVEDDDCNNQVDKWPKIFSQERRRIVRPETVRKLAAGVWRLQVPDAVSIGGGDKRSKDGLGFQVQF